MNAEVVPPIPSEPTVRIEMTRREAQVLREIMAANIRVPNAVCSPNHRFPPIPVPRVEVERVMDAIVAAIRNAGLEKILP